MGPRAGLKTTAAKREISSLCQDSNPGRPVPTLVAILTKLFRLLWEHCTLLQLDLLMGKVYYSKSIVMVNSI